MLQYVYARSMSHPGLLKQTFAKTEVQGRSALPGCGVSPLNPFLLLLLAAAGGEKEEKNCCGGTPPPGKGLTALCNPASQAS